MNYDLSEDKKPRLLDQVRETIRTNLKHLAVNRNVTASTQTQAL